MLSNLTELNVLNNPITHISSEGVQRLRRLTWITLDWAIYLQSGNIEERAQITLKSQFTIEKFKKIFSHEDKSEPKGPFSISSKTQDLIYFTLFVSKALGYSDCDELNKNTWFFSKKNHPVRGLLHLATELEHSYLVEQLIRSWINVNMVDSQNQTAFDIAVDKNLSEIKQILLKRNDLIPNQQDVNLREHPLRIWILDNDESSARIILSNYHFKSWIESQLLSNRYNLQEEFSKILFDVFMVFKENYKSSIFIMHDLVRNWGASLSYFCENTKVTPLLLLAMRNSFKEIIYSIVKNLVELDVQAIVGVNWDHFDTQNNILHYAIAYDRFVAVFRICEAVFRQEYLNVRSVGEDKGFDRNNFLLELLHRLAVMLFTRNKDGDTPKFVSDFNKPSSKYISRLEKYVIQTIINWRRKNMHKQIEEELLINGELSESTPNYEKSLKKLLPYQLHKNLTKARQIWSKIIPLSSIIERKLQNTSSTWLSINKSFSTSASRRSSTQSCLPPLSKKAQRLKAITQLKLSSLKSPLIELPNLYRDEEDIKHELVHLRVDEGSKTEGKSKRKIFNMSANYQPNRRKYQNSKIQMKVNEVNETVFFDEEDSEESIWTENPMLKVLSLSKLPSKADLIKTEAFSATVKYRNYKAEIERIKKNARRQALRRLENSNSLSKLRFQATEPILKPMPSLIVNAKDTVVMPFKDILNY
jgi:hypothetical protein